MTRKRFWYYDENDFNYLENKTKEELIEEIKETNINELNNWMESLEKYMDLVDERNQIINNLIQRIDKAIEYIKQNTIYNEEFPMLPKDIEELLAILRGESNE